MIGIGFGSQYGIRVVTRIGHNPECRTTQNLNPGSNEQKFET